MLTAFRSLWHRCEAWWGIAEAAEKARLEKRADLGARRVVYHQNSGFTPAWSVSE